MKTFFKGVFYIFVLIAVLAWAMPVQAQALRGDFVEVSLLSATSRNATFTGGTISRMHNFKEAVLVLNMISATGDALDALSVFVQHSPDNGTTWLDLGRFVTHVGSTARSQVLFWTSVGPASGTVAPISDLNRAIGSGRVNTNPAGPIWRVVGNLAGTTSLWNFGVSGFFKR